MRSGCDAKMSTEIPWAITIPDSLETRLGPLAFVDGVPDAATIDKLYDNLDFQRGVEAFLRALPAASQDALRKGILEFGPANQTVLVFESLLDARSLLLTGNSETVYALAWIDLKHGPVVIDSPPETLGLVNDAWFSHVADLGSAGPDWGKGGRYLLLPPDHTGDVPDGYYTFQSRSYGNLLITRGFLAGSDPRPTADAMKQRLRIYPLAQLHNPARTRFVNVSGAVFNTIYAADFSFFEEVNNVIQEEPAQAVDAETLGLLAAIGIEKGKAFAPDARMRKILVEAAAVGNATARALTYRSRVKEAYLYPRSGWFMNPAGYEFERAGARFLDLRTHYFFVAIGVSPAMGVRSAGVGSEYAMLCVDSRSQPLDGAKTYRLILPAHIPAKDFWSLVVYDTQTRSMLQTDQEFPSLSSQTRDVATNPDGSVHVCFGPRPAAGRDGNWIQTVRGKRWFLVLRLYGPLDAWFDKSWRPGELEEIGR